MAEANISKSSIDLLKTIKDMPLSEGVTPKKDDNQDLKQLLEAFDSLASNVEDYNDTILKGFKDQQESNPLNDLDSFLGDLVGNKDKDSKSNNKGKDKPTPVDVVKLDPNYGLGSLLIYYKLDEISDFLRTKLSDDSSKKGKSTGIKGFFDNLLKGASGIGALGLGIMAFAGAMNIFNGVEWGQALKGMVLFAGVVLASIFIAREVNDNVENFLKFAVGVTALSVGFMAFATALVIMDYAMDNILKAITGLGLYMVFISGMVVVAKSVDKAKTDFIKFAISSVILSVGLVAFGGALKILDMTMNPTSAAKAGIALGAILLVFGIVGLVGLAAGAAIGAIAIFSVSVLTLSIGLMAFGGALLVLENTVTAERIDNATQTIYTIIGFAIGLSALAKPLAFATISSLLLTVFSVTFLASAVALTAALNLLAFAVGTEVYITPFLQSLGILLGGIASFALILPFSLVASVLLTAFSVTLLASTLALFGVYKALGSINFKTQQVVIGSLLLAILELSSGLTLLTVPLTLGLMGAVALATFSTLVVPSLLGFTKVIKSVDGINLNKDNRDIYIDTIRNMSSFMLAVVKMLSTDIKTVKKNAKLFSEVMEPIVNVFLNTFDMLKQVADFNPPDNLDAQVQMIFESILDICDLVTEKATTLKGSALKASKKFGEAFLPVSEVLVNMMSVLQSSQDLSLENGGADKMVSNIAEVLTSINTILFPAIVSLDKAPSAKKLQALQEVLKDCNACIELINKNDSNIDLATYLKNFVVDESQLKEVSTSINSLKDVFKQVAYLSELLDGTKMFSKNLEKMAFSFERIYSSTQNLQESSNNINEWELAVSQMASTFLKDDVASKMDTISNSFRQMTTSLDGIEHGLDPLNKLASNATTIIRVAEAITKMANSTKGMNGAAINNIDRLSGAKASIADSPTKVNRSSVDKTDSPEQMMLSILQMWQATGYGVTVKNNAQAGGSSYVSKEKETPENGGLFGWLQNLGKGDKK